ncbi:Nitrogen permease reactivator protein, partial [Clonorchis sinensis]
KVESQSSSNACSIDVKEINDFDKTNGAASTLSYTSLFATKRRIQTSKINDTIVRVKIVQRSDFMITPEIFKEIGTISSLRHRNLNSFFGVCDNAPEFRIHWEYCSRESLHDVIQRSYLPVGWAFRFSMLIDIARGMKCLHNHHIIHSRLCSANCLVDEHWTCKVTDFGLDGLRFENNLEKIKTFINEHEPFVAPEYLGRPDLDFVPAMDVYSFGAIMYEVATRVDLAKELEACSGSSCFLKGTPRKTCFQEESYESNVAPERESYCELMRMCLGDIISRPNFFTIKKHLRKINPQQNNASATVKCTVDAYCLRLETLLEDRMKDLRTERRMTDQLLQSMLPKSVVEQLRLGHSIVPEAFEQCTIYFSDIVGFTSLSAKSTPLEVVGLLNKLYTEFDEVIDRYDVYKVETIGDAYMVASGVPRRNGCRHATAITDMSLDLVNVSRDFVIPHMPQEPLKIRVGIHSGPVCAGVVGLKMPRYCLFGDTVNTASRMESNGEAYKIHCSDTTHNLLEESGGFEFERRGTILVKGKGEMQTWWVLRRLREELDHDVCPLPAHFGQKAAIKEEAPVNILDAVKSSERFRE